jgi:hypothetical protein
MMKGMRCMIRCVLRIEDSTGAVLYRKGRVQSVAPYDNEEELAERGSLCKLSDLEPGRCLSVLLLASSTLERRCSISILF